MRYLVCTNHLSIHLTCPAPWLADALRRKGYPAEAEETVVVSSAPRDTVELLLSYRPPRTSGGAFASCSNLD